MSTRNDSRRAAVMIAVAAFPAPAWSSWLATTSSGGATVGADLHVLALGACAAVVVGVYCAMIRALVKAGGRRSGDRHGPVTEIMWTLAAAAILLATAYPATSGLLRDGGAGGVGEGRQGVYHDPCPASDEACASVVAELSTPEEPRRWLDGRRQNPPTRPD